MGWPLYLSFSEIEKAKRRKMVVQLRDESKLSWPEIGTRLNISHEAASELYKSAKRIRAERECHQRGMHS